MGVYLGRVGGSMGLVGYQASGAVQFLSTWVEGTTKVVSLIHPILAAACKLATVKRICRLDKNLSSADA